MTYLELLEALKDARDLARRTEAAERLGKLGDRRAVPALLEALEDPYLDVRDNAAYALAELGERSVIPALVRLLRDPTRQMRKTAVKGLGMLRAEEAVEQVAAALGDPSYLVRKSAIRSLGQIGGARAVEALRGVARSDTEPMLKDLADRTLRELTSARRTPPPKKG